MIKLTISRNDNVYECFPDIAQANDGSLICVYRECMGHSPWPFSRMVVRRSIDNGMNWSEKNVLLECVTSEDSIEENKHWIEEDAFAEYKKTKSRINEDWQIGTGINCPRIITLNDGTLLLIVDLAHWIREKRTHTFFNLIWRSKDNGISWEGPEKINVPEGIVPSLLQLKNGDIILGLATPDVPNEKAFICRSSDGGKTWSEPLFVPSTKEKQIDEVCYVELDDETIVGVGRNLYLERVHKPTYGLKIISRDGGNSWEGPFDTFLVGLEGRPKSGLLRSGEVCITYRCSLPNEMLALFVITQEAFKSTEQFPLIERVPLVEDKPTRNAREKKQERPWYMEKYYPGRCLILDADRSVHRDEGYSGWVQLDNGNIFVVDYINDDAPLAQIRGYIVSREDIILFPEGDLPWFHPSGQPFRKMTIEWAEKQIKQNQRKDT